MTENTETPQNNIQDQFSLVFNNLTEMSKTCKTMLDDVKNIQKQYKVTEKKSRHKKKRPQVDMEPSKELTKFLNISGNITKADAMRQISSFIKEHKLQIEENKRKFIPNKELMKLFKINSAPEMTFIEINKYLIQHLSKLE